MRGAGDDRRALVVGEEWRLTRAALVGAGVLFLLGMVVDYLSMAALIAGRDHALVAYLRRTFLLADVWGHGWEGLTPWTWLYGYLLVVGLAGSHAYFNLGYLPSVLLALSANAGTGVWAIKSPSEQYMVLTPAAVVGELPVGLAVATLGFLLGVALRPTRHPPQDDRSPNPPVPDQ